MSLSRQFASGSPRPVRVMHVVYALRPGGMEFGVVKVSNGLDPARVQSAICSTQPAGELRSLLSPVVGLFELQRRDGNDVRVVRDLYRLFRRERPDIVHTHAWGTLVEGLVAARLAGVPIVVHGEHGTLQLRSYQRWVQRRAWAAADVMLSVSARLAERIARETRFPLARIRVIRNGVDLSRFKAVRREAARAALHIDPNTRVAVTVGRLVAVKDHANLLDALALLRRDGVGCTMMLAGDGPLRQSLIDRARSLGVADSVRFLGHRADVETVLAAADLFVLSSESEGLSNTILEAMAAGLPVVATRVGGADEMVQEGVTGLLVPPKSPTALAQAMASLLASPPMARAMGQNARDVAESDFSLPGMIQRYESMYLELVSVRTTPAVGSAARVERSGVA